jgi:hypothetical protein
MSKKKSEGIKRQIKKLSDTDYGAVCRCVKGLVNQTAPFNLEDRDASRVRELLVPHRGNLKKLISSKSIAHKRALHKQRGGAIFTALIAALVPIIAQLIANAVTKK